MKSTGFITGTDTGIGKTWCTLGLIQHFKAQQLRVAGMKPIATGCYAHPEGLRNLDAEHILTVSGLNVPYRDVNPYAFAPPLPPHLAAAYIGQTITLAPIIKAYHRLMKQADIVIIEGIGGWRVPLNAKDSLKELVQALDAQVILVVGLRLGCINHALLSAETIIRDGCKLVGWIANTLDSHFNAQAVIDTLSERLTIPLLAQVPYLPHQNILQLAQAMQTVTRHFTSYS